MNQLIELKQTNLDGQMQPSANARELYGFLDVKSRFNDWIKNRIEEYDFIENQDFVTLTKNLVNGGKQNEYYISLDMAKELSMVERNEKGKQARQYFLACERKAKQTIPTLPTTFSEALRLAADLQDQLAIAAPKAAALDLLSDRTDTINFRLAAKHLKVKEPVLKNKLVQLGWVIKNSNPMTIKAKASDSGYMIQNTGIAPNGHQYSQALITSKGLAKLAEHFSQSQNENGSNLLPDQGLQITAIRQPTVKKVDAWAF